MSESDNSSTSGSSEEELLTDEDIGEQSSLVQPYQDEPMASSDYEDEPEADEDGIERADLEARFLRTVPVDSW